MKHCDVLLLNLLDIYCILACKSTNTTLINLIFIRQLPQDLFYKLCKRRVKIPKINETLAFFLALDVPCESKSSSSNGCDDIMQHNLLGL